MLAQALSIISLVFFGVCVRLFVAVNFIYIYLKCFFFVLLCFVLFCFLFFFFHKIGLPKNSSNSN